jgi:hypothetical protein
MSSPLTSRNAADQEPPVTPDRSGIPKKPKPRPVGDIVAAGNDGQDEPDDLDAAEGDYSRGTLAVYASRALLIRAPSLQPPDPEKVAFDPEIFAQNPPYTFRAEISSDRMDAYGTRMHPSSLKNYAEDADQGVALQNSHRSDELPMGHSYRGRYASPSTQPDQIAKTHADFYVVPGLKLNDVHSDDFIRGIRGGVIRDVSVGFYGGHYRCTICGERLLGINDEGEFDCGHVPMLTYRVKLASGDEDDQQAATWVHDARLAEVSTVYDGATPGAGIIKAKQMAESGRLNPMQARFLETQYRIRLFGSQRYFPGADPRRGTDTAIVGDHRMSDPLPVTHDPANGLPISTDPAHGSPAPGETTANPLLELLTEAGLVPGDDPLAATRAMMADYVRLKAAAPPPAADPSPPPQERAVPVQERDLADARAYRQRTVEEAKREAVRALGNDFDADAYVARWNQLPVADVARERDQYAVIAGKLFPGGRRGLADQERREDDPNRPRTVPPVPDSVYASGAGFAVPGARERGNQNS